MVLQHLSALIGASMPPHAAALCSAGAWPTKNMVFLHCRRAWPPGKRVMVFTREAQLVPALEFLVCADWAIT
ncbi:MAG: hypothetical protein ACN6OT_17415 [Comamonas sp.]|uniref:hypothetical protein n=1 Tax=Comamonas sp. 23 TaxID=3415008 RepID=UPI001057EEA3